MNNLIRVTIRAFFRVLGYYPATIGGLRFKVDPDHIGFWREVSADRWEPRTLEVLMRHLTPDSCYVDVGAWIGPTVLYAARRARQVYCLEPDYDAYHNLVRNIRRNGLRNVVPFNLALGDRSGLRRMGAFGSRLGVSKTSLISTESADGSVDVWCIRWSDWLSLTGAGRVDFIKIDIEGGEFELLPDMKDYLRAERPALSLSLHAPLLREEERGSALDRIADALGAYGMCFDEAGRRVTLPEVASWSRDQFRAFLFLR